MIALIVHSVVRIQLLCTSWAITLTEYLVRLDLEPVDSSVPNDKTPTYAKLKRCLTGSPKASKNQTLWRRSIHFNGCDHKRVPAHWASSPSAPKWDYVAARSSRKRQTLWQKYMIDICGRLDRLHEKVVRTTFVATKDRQNL